MVQVSGYASSELGVYVMPTHVEAMDEKSYAQSLRNNLISQVENEVVPGDNVANAELTLNLTEHPMGISYEEADEIVSGAIDRRIAKDKFIELINNGHMPTAILF